MSGERVRLEAGWKARLADEFAAPYLQGLRAFLVAEKQAGKTLFLPLRRSSRHSTRRRSMRSRL